MKLGARCKHCGNYRVFMIETSTGKAVKPIQCPSTDHDACEPAPIHVHVGATR